MGKEYRVAFVLFLGLALLIAEARSSFLGKRQPISVNDSGVIEAAEIIMKRINQEHHGKRALMLVKIERAESQVLYGIKYFLDLKVGERHCLEQNLSRKCKLNKNCPYKSCIAFVYSGLWGSIKESHYNCREYEN
ncbi:cystatin 2 [Bracoviriform congregatae]|uniref:Cystatin 2 n=1 Tax=Bracoviriform congregatae TaxID=39640 RepID=Q5ZNY8_9VIRU|nr:cystatin 2 [Bracoviriform congregatae]CAG17471.1 cystatin 2 [Bracoviriform congregatae]